MIQQMKVKENEKASIWGERRNEERINLGNTALRFVM